LHNEKLHDFLSLNRYYSGDNIKEDKTCRHVARIGGRRKINTGFWWGNSEERDHLEDLCVDGRKMLKHILKPTAATASTATPAVN
jgi:hypothetical protein